jgi:hypothetical protein
MRAYVAGKRRFEFAMRLLVLAMQEGDSRLEGIDRPLLA